MHVEWLQAAKNVDKLTAGAINFYYRANSLAPSDNHEVAVDSLYTLVAHTVVLDNCSPVRIVAKYLLTQRETYSPRFVNARPHTRSEFFAKR